MEPSRQEADAAARQVLAQHPWLQAQGALVGGGVIGASSVLTASRFYGFHDALFVVSMLGIGGVAGWLWVPIVLRRAYRRGHARGFRRGSKGEPGSSRH